jgi:hypothetical protein
LEFYIPYIWTNIYTHIPLIHKCYTKTNGLERSYKYTNIHNFNKLPKSISKTSIGNHHGTTNSYRMKEVCKYFPMATLNIVFSFLRIVKLHGKLPKSLIPA